MDSKHGRLLYRQLYADPSALARTLRKDREGTLVSVDDRFGDKKTEARSIGKHFSRFFSAKELFEQAWMVFLRNPDTSIDDLDRNDAPFVRHAHDDRPAGRRVLDSIIEQVFKHDDELAAVEVGYWQGIRKFGHHANMFGFRGIRKNPDRDSSDVAYIARLNVVLEFSTRDPFDVEQIVRESVYRIGRAAPLLYKLLLFRQKRALAAREEEAKDPTERGERRAKLMCGDRDELRLRALNGHSRERLLSSAFARNASQKKYAEYENRDKEEDVRNSALDIGGEKRAHERECPYREYQELRNSYLHVKHAVLLDGVERREHEERHGKTTEERSEIKPIPRSEPRRAEEKAEGNAHENDLPLPPPHGILRQARALGQHDRRKCRDETIETYEPREEHSGSRSKRR